MELKIALTLLPPLFGCGPLMRSVAAGLAASPPPLAKQSAQNYISRGEKKKQREHRTMAHMRRKERGGPNSSKLTTRQLKRSVRRYIATIQHMYASGLPVPTERQLHTFFSELVLTRGSNSTTSALKLSCFDVGSDKFVASIESKVAFGVRKSVLRTSVVVVRELRSGLVRKLTVGNVVEPLERPPAGTVARDLMSLEVCLNATRSRIIVGTMDLSNENEKGECGWNGSNLRSAGR